MQFEISPIQLVTIGAVMNGFVFTFLLFEKKENRQANVFLSLMILSMCLTFTPFILDTTIWNTYESLAFLPFSLSYWIGPSFYFYIKTLTGSSSKFRKKDLWHFAPIVLNYLHSIYHAIIVNTNPWPIFHHVAELLELGAIVSVAIYLVVSFNLVKNYQRSLLDNVSNIEKIDLRWVTRIIYVIGGCCLLILIFLIASQVEGGRYILSEWDDPRAFILLLYSCILYWLSISGFKQAQTHKIVPGISSSESNDINEFSEIIETLKKVIEENKLYQNQELTLSDLSKSTKISERSISDAINQELRKNFFQFINEYRVEEVKTLLNDPKNDHLKIMSLALDAGFNSKATFNRIFKAYTGQTPKDFKNRNS